MNTLFHLLLGAIAGWLAGRVMRGDGYGVVIDIILGLVGGWVGGLIGEQLGLSLGGSLGYLITAFLGAVLLVWISRLIKGKA